MLIKKHISNKKLFLCIFIYAFGIRLVANFITTPTFQNDFFSIAYNILYHGFYSIDGIHQCMFRPPLYPLALTLISFLFGTAPIVYMLFTSAIGAINALLCAMLAQALFGRKSALIAGIVYATIPYLARQEMLSEIGFLTLWVLAGLYAQLIAWKNPLKPRFFYYSALFFAFAFLTRQSIGLIPIFTGLSIVLAAIKLNRSPRHYIIHSTAFFMLIALLITPWFLYGRKSFGNSYAGERSLWGTAYEGNHPRAFEVFPKYSFDYVFPIVALEKWPRQADEDKLMHGFRTLAIEQFREIGAGAVMLNSFRKFAYLWSPRLTPYYIRIRNAYGPEKFLDIKRSLAENCIFSIPYTFILIFAGIGIWIERKQRGLIILTCGLILCFSMPYVLTTVCSRYAAPAYFIFIIWASRGIQKTLPK